MKNVIRCELREMLAIFASVVLLSFNFYSSDAAAQQCCGEVFNVNYSTSSDRSGGLRLQDATVTGNIHIFVDPIAPSSGILKVKWYLDSPIDQANIFRVDSAAPYDLIGGNGVAIPLDTTTLTEGTHTITAKLVFGGSPRVRQDVTVTFEVGNEVVPPPATGSWEFGVGETADRLFAAAEMFPDPTGVLELFFGQVFIFIGESNTCNLAGCVAVDDPQNPPPPVITGVTFTFDMGFDACVAGPPLTSRCELVVNEDTLAPYDLGGIGNDPTNPGFNLDDLFPGVHTLTASIAILDGEPVTLTRSFLTQPLIAVLPPTLKGEVPLEDEQLADGNGIIVSTGASIALGKALFWDLQTGGDGRQACATCHYHAGVDNRVLNTVNPKSGGFEVDSGGPGGVLVANDFDFHNFVDPLDRGSAVNRSIDDVVGSQGLVQKDFAGINVGSDEDSFVDPIFPDLNFVDAAGKSQRRVTGRNAPTNINAAFNVRSFWDGRANFVFNGVNPFGARDPGAVVYVDNDGVGGSAPVGEQLRIRFASLASQAVGPANNAVEMSFEGRTFPELGRKLLNLTPLWKQEIAPDDSVFGPTGPLGCIIANGCASGPQKGLDLSHSYAELIMASFDPKYWNGDDVMIGGTSYTLMEANFAMFFGLAIQKWEFTLVSDDSKWDRFRQGTDLEQRQKIDLAQLLAGNNEEPGAVLGNTDPFDPADILTNAETRGMNSFLGGACNACHGGAVLSAATTPFILGPVPGAEPAEQVVERMLMEQGVAALELGLPAPSAMYDLGFYNIAVRPTAEDLGIGAQDDFGNPLSFASQLQSGIHVDDGLDAPIPGALPLPDFLVVDPNLFVRSPGASPIGAPIAVNGAFKVPTLRNIELTAPYMHNGGTMSLENVVAFYARGADFLDENIADVDPEVGGIGNLRGNPDGVADLVTFLRVFTDNRVKEEAGPFDHPSILLENGVVVEAVGTSGLGTGVALPTFADRLNGPTAFADDYMINVDEVLVDNVLDNDSDGDGSGSVQNPLSIVTEGPFNGTLNELNADGSFTYTPDGGFRGVDGFAYDMDTTDGTDPRSNVARVTIQVGSAVPVANPDMYNTGFETPLAVPAPGVLGNDDDPDSPITAVLSGAAPANALAFGLNLDGSFSYTPNPGFSGPDTFMYTANDADGPSAPAMVTIEVAPDATPCPTDGQIWLCYSLSADRSNPLLLDGGTVSGPIYVFKTPIVPTSPIIKVKWYMDSAITQENLLSSDTTAPYDFNGGSPVDLSPGSHTITGKVVFDSSPRTRQDFPATFTVE